VDIVGSSIKEEAEILSLTNNVFNELGLKIIINFNNRKLINEVLDNEGIKKKEEVIREIDKLDKLSIAEINKNLKKYNAEKVLEIFKKPESYFKKYESYSEIKELKKYCNYYGIKLNFQPFLARGLSYYNGSIFEIKTSKMKETICAGGSYLINNIQSTGISFGLERLSKLAKIDFEQKNVLIISLNEDKESIKISEKFRKENIFTYLLFGKPSKAMQYANSKNISYVLFVGEKELKEKKFKLKDMKSGKEQKLSLDKIIKKINLF
jgi:histidyl-tRNA synthetase